MTMHLTREDFLGSFGRPLTDPPEARDRYVDPVELEETLRRLDDDIEALVDRYEVYDDLPQVQTIRASLGIVRQQINALQGKVPSQKEAA